jgi:hypothetical protein
MSRCCRMFNRCLVWCSMHLGVPFLAPRDLGAIWAPFGRLWLPSVHGCTGQSTVQQQRIPWSVTFCFWGHRTVRWVASDHWPEVDVATSHWLAGTSDCPSHRADGLVNYSRQRLIFTESWLFDGPCTRLSGGWHRIVWCYTDQSAFYFFNLNLFCFFLFDFIKSLALRQIWLVPKTIVSV